MNADDRYELQRKLRDIREDLESIDDQLLDAEMEEQADKIRAALNAIGEIKL